MNTEEANVFLIPLIYKLSVTTCCLELACGTRSSLV